MNLARAASALADPVRLNILSLLSDRESISMRCCPSSPLGLCVCDIADNLRISQPRASYHLRILREAGFIEETPRGSWSHYRLRCTVIKQFCSQILDLTGIKED